MKNVIYLLFGIVLGWLTLGPVMSYYSGESEALRKMDKIIDILYSIEQNTSK